VVLNLILNAVEAMGSVEAGARELSIRTEQHQTEFQGVSRLQPFRRRGKRAFKLKVY
jgi:hypothetical protein